MRSLLLALAVAFVPMSAGRAQTFAVPAAGADAAVQARSLAVLAGAAADVYRDGDRRTELSVLFRLQAVAGRYDEAMRSLDELERLDAAPAAYRDLAADLENAAFVRAKANLAQHGGGFDAAYPRALRDLMAGAEDQVAARMASNLTFPDASAQATLAADLKDASGKPAISLAEAVKLAGDAYAADRARQTAGLAAALVAEEDARRYEVRRDIQVRTPDGATVCALVVRPRTTARLPAILEFTIYADPRTTANEARLAAAHGFVGVVGLTRGKGCSPDAPVPFEHDGADADTLIGWIAAQPWSDGKVGMFGGSYNGFAAWAATKHKPAALKAIMVGAPEGPDIDTPAENGVVWNFIYPWPLYTTDNKTLDDAAYGDAARWARLNHDWYVSGRAYRDLERIDGAANPVWDRWLSHPTYDAYWRSLVPSGADFARVDIPVLQTSGYFFGGPAASVHYFQQHYRYRPKAEDYLVVGPWDHLMAQRGPYAADVSVAGYALDKAAMVDLVTLRFEWFDYTLKGAPRPAFLKDRVNFEVTGADTWKHAPSIAAMSDHSLRLHLSADRMGGGFALKDGEPGHGRSVPLTIDLADRRDVDRPAVGGVQDRRIDTANAVVFTSEPLAADTEISGLPSGVMDVAANKRDFDFEIDLYALSPAGDYFALAPYWTRASLAADPGRRQLLQPGRRTRIAFTGMRLMSHRLTAGSRIVAVVSVIKDPGREINYGTGKPVIDETIADAGPPLKLEWFEDSFLDLPVGRP